MYVHVTWISDLLVLRVRPFVRYSPYRESTPCDMHVPAKTLCAHKDMRRTDTDTIPCIVLTSYITCLDWNKFRNGNLRIEPQYSSLVLLPSFWQIALQSCIAPFCWRCTAQVMRADAWPLLWGNHNGIGDKVSNWVLGHAKVHALQGNISQLLMVR